MINLGGNMLVTCLAILAVDFRIFPRRFAKTETFGISLMDIGVGTFIVSSAVTSRYARGQYPPRIIKGSNIENSDNNNNGNGNGNEKNDKNENENYEKKSKNDVSYSEFYRIIQLFFYLQTQNWKHYLVLVLGLGRMIALKVFNYHENVSEYGVHWNFFVTLFSIWQISDFLHRFLSRKFLPWFAITVLLLYQFTLSKTTMTDFIFAASRKNFFYANREGFLSLFGYVPMYLLVEMLAHHFFYNCENDNENEDTTEMNYEHDNEDSINGNTKSNYSNNNNNNDKRDFNYIKSSSSKESNNNSNEESETNNDEIGNDENDFIIYNNNIRNSSSIGENRPGSNIGKNNSGKFRKTDFPTFSQPEKPKKYPDFFSFRSYQTTDSTNSDKDKDKECSSTLLLSPHSPSNNNNNNNNNSNNRNNQSNKRNLNYRKNVLHYPYFKDKIGNKNQRHFYRQLSVIIAVLWTAWLASTSVQQTSRRLANLAYVSLVLALSFTLILLIAVADSMGDLVLSYKGSQLNNMNNNNHNSSNNHTSNIDNYDDSNNNQNNNNKSNENKSINVNDNTTIDEINTKSLKIDLPQHPAVPLTMKTLECLNEFQLPVFLVSNVITGIINMTIKTIYSSHIFAFFILSSYAMTFIGFAWIVSEKFKKK